MCIDRLNNTIFPYAKVGTGEVDSYHYDYSRVGSLELIAKELEEGCVYGAVAEVGVYRGEFACLLNQIFSSRKLFLFDTYEGFNQTQINEEKDSGYAKNSFLQSIDKFANTNIDLVLGKMKYPNNCIIKKGFFPQTTENIDDKFCLACIDVDFYQPTMDALDFFIPRVIHGGYIFIHDYNDDELSGVKTAIADYEKRHGRLSKVPLSDHSGTLVISL